MSFSACLYLPADGFPHQFTPMRMERQPRDGEILPNERARVLKPYSVINVELYDNAHVTLWIRGMLSATQVLSRRWHGTFSPQSPRALSDNPSVGSVLQIRR
jgi:hypothetical protein